ncbi:MAG: XRE family transcriptional regulator [Clostridia bacterium]|nr:XRE family transcriptional regulator [Clostridia bacterium]
MLDNALLAEQIKHYRKKNGLSQVELAERINVSGQAISKWERGVSLPELDKLCLLAELFRLSVDDLLGIAQNHPKYMIGVDGGGSKTQMILFDENGRTVETLLVGACNPNSIGIEAATAVLRDGITQLCRLVPRVSGVFIGASGFATGKNGEAIRAALQGVFPHIAIGCDTDIVNVFASAGIEGDCMALICGTGTVVCLRKNDEITRFTGWGYLLDRSGSGFHIGRDAITAALECAEGLGAKTLLQPMLESVLGTSVRDCVKHFYANDSSYIASFAKCVFEACEQGDFVAHQILSENAARLANVIRRVTEQCPTATKVIASGSVITKNQILREMLADGLGDRLELVLPKLSQAQGACILCAQMCGVDAATIRAAFCNQQEER